MQKCNILDKEFKKGDIVIAKKSGLYSVVDKSSPKGELLFSSKIIQGNPLRVSENARSSVGNKVYFRKANKNELKKFESRFSF